MPAKNNSTIIVLLLIVKNLTVSTPDKMDCPCSSKPHPTYTFNSDVIHYSLVTSPILLGIHSTSCPTLTSCCRLVRDAPSELAAVHELVLQAGLKVVKLQQHKCSRYGIAHIMYIILMYGILEHQHLIYLMSLMYGRFTRLPAFIFSNHTVAGYTTHAAPGLHKKGHPTMKF